MVQELKVDIFDIAMLDMKNRTDRATDIVPFCPMLRVGWSYLNSSTIAFSKVLYSVKPFLIPSPWTAFKEEGMRILGAALEGGTLS
jgi:hypothetical protein